MGELSDAEVFGSQAPNTPEMSDAEVFGTPAAPPPAAPKSDVIDQLKTTAANIPSAGEQHNQNISTPQSYLEGLVRGGMQGQLGVQQALSKFPVIGSLYGNEQENQAKAKMLQEWGKGSGVSGTAGEIIGNPIDRASIAAMPEGIMARGTAGALQGALQPTTGEGTTTGENAAIGAGLNVAIPPVVSGIAKGAGAAIQGVANKTGITDVSAKIADLLGSNPTTSKLYQAAKSIGMDTKGKSPTEIKDNLQAAFTKSTGDIKDIISGGTELNPVAANSAISTQYDKALEQSNQLYSNVKKLGEGKFTDAKDLLNNTNQLVDELESKKNLSPKEERGLNELKFWQQKIQEASKGAEPDILTMEKKSPDRIAYNDVIGLKQALNQGFNPSDFPTRADTPFIKLTSGVNDTLKSISDEDQSFGAALKEANDHWTDFSRTYKNDLINQFWTPDDYHEAKALTDRGVPLSTSLRKRARGMIDNIKTPEDLETLTNALPLQAADSVKAAKFQQIMEKAGVDPTAIYENRDTLDRIFRNNPEASKLLDNITTVMDGLNEKGLGNNMSQQITRESQQGNDEALRTVWSMATNHKLYALKHALNTIAPAEKTTGKALKSFQKEIQAGAPLRKTISNTASNIAPGLGRSAAIAAENKIEQ